MARYLVSLRGTLATSSVSEIFSHSLCINSVSAQAGVALAVRLAWSQLWTSGGLTVQSGYNSQVTYNEVVVAEILNLELGTVTAAHHEPFTPPLAGNGSGAMLPSQNAIAISFKAGTRPNGTPLRGRSYMPAPRTGLVLADGLLDPAWRDSFATQWQAFLQTLKGASHLPSVWSRTIPTTQTIDQVRVGDRVDTVRRRRNHLPESYKVLAVS